jgi:hypothetical protein
MKRLIISIIFSALITTLTFAQILKDSLANDDDFYNKMLEFSRPGKYHQLLADLVGSWTFTGAFFSENPNPDSNKEVFKFTGTLVRKPFANGRFFIAEGTGHGKLQMPIQDGKMKEVNEKSIETMGYDNVKKKFIRTYINNHIGSDISYSEGNYDSTANTITFYSEGELIPGMKLKTQELFIILNKDHYRIEDYNEQNGKYVKATEINYIRVKLK